MNIPKQIKSTLINGGYYYVLKNERWLIAEYNSNIDIWYIPGIETKLPSNNWDAIINIELISNRLNIITYYKEDNE